jgi:rhodanese-related sulfurtransferase
MQRIARLALAAAPVVLAACLFAPMTVGAGEPTPAPAPATAAQPAQARMTPMTQEQLLEHLRSHPDHLFVLDVRTPQEFAEGHVPGAVNVPYDQVASRLAEVPKDKDVVLYCRSGRRAGLAADVLAAQGYTRLSHLEGDMTAWVEKGRPVEK